MDNLILTIIVLNEMTGIIVDAEEIRKSGCLCQDLDLRLVRHEAPALIAQDAVDLAQGFRPVAARKRSIQQEFVGQRILKIGSECIGRLPFDWIGSFQPVRNADFSGQLHAFVKPYCSAVREHHAMHHLHGLAHRKFLIWRKKSRDILPGSQREGIFQGDPVTHTAAETLKTNPCILQECFCCFLSQPVSFLEKVERRIKMIKHHIGLDAIFQAGINEITVVLQPGFVDPAIRSWKNTRPGNRYRKRLQIELPAALDIFTIAMEKITGLFSIKALIRPLQEAIPAAGTAAALPGASFYLECRCSCTEYKVLWKCPYHPTPPFTLPIIKNHPTLLFSPFENIFMKKSHLC